MADDQINNRPSSTIIDSFEALFEYIDAHPIYPINNHYQLLDYLEIDEQNSDKQYKSIYQPNTNKQMKEKSLLFPHMSRTDCQASPVDNNDEILFDSTEWQTDDLSKQKRRPPKLYEYLHLLLNNPRYTSYASWLNKEEGLFKIHKPMKVAELWEKVKARKTNRDMDYDKFARGIRYYYDDGTMIATYTKHTYRFSKHQ